MSKKTFTFSIIIIVILAVFASWYFFFRSKSQENSNQTATSTQNLFPFGQNNPSSGGTSTGQGGTSTTPVINESGTSVLPTLIHITNTPIAGAIFLPEGKNASSTIVRYIDRGTGHIYDYNILMQTTSEVENTTMPEIYEGMFSPDGARVILRFLDSANNVETVSADVGATTTPAVAGTLSDIRYLPKNITSISINPAGKLFFIQDTGSGSIGYTSALDGTSATDVWESPLEQVSASWMDPQYILINTKPSALADGYALTLNSKTDSALPIISNMAGLESLENTDGDFIFGSAANDGVLQSFVWDVKKNVEMPLTIKTIPEKCVWSLLSPDNVYCAVPESISSNNMPDDWDQGLISLDANDIWKINGTTGEATVLDFLSNTNNAVDAENLFLDQNEQWIGFMDKSDLSLWALRIQ